MLDDKISDCFQYPKYSANANRSNHIVLPSSDLSIILPCIPHSMCQMIVNPNWLFYPTIVECPLIPLPIHKSVFCNQVIFIFPFMATLVFIQSTINSQIIQLPIHLFIGRFTQYLDLD